MSNIKPLKVGSTGLSAEFASGDTVAPSIGGTGANNSPSDGHILIGSTSGGDYVDGSLTSTGGTLTVTQGSGTLNAEVVTQVAVNNCRIYGASGLPYNNGGATIGTLYFGPCSNLGKFLTLDNGSGTLSIVSVSQISLSLASGFTSGNVYDVYVYNNSGTLTLDTVVWTNTTTPPTRGTDAAGRLTKNGATNELLVGAIYMISNTATQDTGSARYVSNIYNAVSRGMSCTDATATWTVTSTTFVAANGNTTNGTGRVSFLQAFSTSTFQAMSQAEYSNSSGTQTISGWALDSTTTANVYGVNEVGADSSITATGNIGQGGASLLGVHFVQRVEAVQGSGTSTGIGNTHNLLSVVVLN